MPSAEIAESNLDRSPVADEATANGRGLWPALFGVFWRLTFLFLPWQTRYFWEGPQVAGWPWEQGRLSVYASWLPLLITVVAGCFLADKRSFKSLVHPWIWMAIALGAFSWLANPIHPAATVQWWLQVGLLAMFAVALVRASVKTDKLVFWFVLSVLPGAALAVWQAWSQNVWGWSWLGMSAQVPATLGVAVVQTDALRWLRAYGNFPHPNILGAWMAVAAVAAVWLATRTKSKAFLKYFYLPAIALILAALFYSFSRAAWVAAAMGLGVLALSLAAHLSSFLRGRSSGKEAIKIRMIVFVLPVVLFAFLSIINRDLVWSRAAVASRVEERSVATRAQSLRDGLRVFVTHPFFGTGQGNYLPALASVNNPARAGSPLEPPHMFWLLALDEAGSFGFVAIFVFFVSAVWLMWRARRTNDRMVWCLGASVMAVWLTTSLFDHYAWSLWSGQALTALVGVFVSGALTSQRTVPEQGADLP